MTIHAAINGFTVTGAADNKWEATCPNDGNTFAFDSLTSAYFYCRLYVLCECGDHSNGTSIRTRAAFRNYCRQGV